MDYQKLIIKGISYSQNQSGAYALLLEHEASKVKLPIIIGGFEAQAITLGLEKELKPSRPLTHDLFGNFVEAANYRLNSMMIYQIIDGVFYSNLNFTNKTTEEELVIDARTSDAVAMAVRFSAPIFATNDVIEVAGILLDDEIEISTEDDADDSDTVFEDLKVENSLELLPTEELNRLLDQAVADEDFDAALEIQEEIKRRKD